MIILTLQAVGISDGGRCGERKLSRPPLHPLRCLSRGGARADVGGGGWSDWEPGPISPSRPLAGPHCPLVFWTPERMPMALRRSLAFEAGLAAQKRGQRAGIAGIKPWFHAGSRDGA